MTTEGVLVRRFGDIIQSPGSFDIIGDKVNNMGIGQMWRCCGDDCENKKIMCIVLSGIICHTLKRVTILANRRIPLKVEYFGEIPHKLTQNLNVVLTQFPWIDKFVSSSKVLNEVLVSLMTNYISVSCNR